jgi:alkaline phosphatase D
MTITGSWDTRISRRTLLRTGGSAAAGIVLLGHTATAKAAPPFSGYPFTLGVASGDPTPNGIVLWTRLAPKPLEGGGLPQEVFGVRYEVAADENFSRIVRRGAIDALPDEAHTVHAEIGGLQPETPYWYRFRFGPVESPVGRTRTAPPPDSTAAMRFAYASCQNYVHGFYNAYADMAEQDLDLVVHLGDYIYEGPGTGRPANVRRHAPEAELMSLGDYRTRHAQYRTDRHLQAAHAAFPWLMTWDDHEFEDNYANLAINPETPIEDVQARRAAAYLAYWEHAPLSRSRKPLGHNMHLYRRAHWGRLATFHVLDTRQYRDDQITQCTQAERDRESGYCPGQLDESRTILGADQRDWLLTGLAEAPREGWNVLANQVGFAPQDDLGDARRRFFVDPWDGYVRDRQRILDVVKGLGNMVVITGDKHQNSVRNVPESYRKIDGPAAATEFVGTSISSQGDEGGTAAHADDNPHILWENFQRGYVRVQLDPQHWTTEFRVVSTVTAEQATAWTEATWMVDHGKPGAYRPESVVSPV